MNAKPKKLAQPFLLLMALCRLSGASNQLQNPGFETPTGVPDSPYTYTGSGYGGDSAAEFWGIYNFNTGTTNTNEQYASSCPLGLSNEGMYSLLVETTAIDDGVQQGFGSPSAFTASVSGYVYVISGSVGIGLVNNSNELVEYASTSTTGQWIFLGANTGGLTGNQTFDIFSLTPNSEFYVDNVDADTNALTPEPASFALLGLGAAGLLLRRRRAKG